MTTNKRVDWQTTADILDDATDEEISAAMDQLNPSGRTAGEEVEYALKQFQAMGIMPEDGEEPDLAKQMEAMGRMMNGDFDFMQDAFDEDDEDDD